MQRNSNLEFSLEKIMKFLSLRTEETGNSMKKLGLLAHAFPENKFL